MKSYRRPVGELPGDPGRLSLEYRLQEPLGGAEDRDGIEEWAVSVRVGRFRDRTVGGVVGALTFFRLRQDERFSPSPAGDAQGEDSALFHTVMGCYDLGRGGYGQEFRDAMTSAEGDLLVLWDVRLDPEWRGVGLGAVLASQALWTLGAGCAAVAAAPDGPALTALCESVGFRLCPRPLGCLLDPAAEEARDAREEQRRRYDALTDAWRAARHA
ncbi:hypothetical protein ACFY2D_24055 [Streptomyces nigra]|jgi:hypothetical protein|uniref:hypothetical protein n=1 Tax=Streptomyces nigra TaxID=1827580 RepID=UPI00362AA832